MHIALVLLLLVPVAASPAAASPAAASSGEAPTALQGGQPGSRALVVALHGGSYRGRTPLERARQLLLELSAESRNAGLRLLVPVAPEPPTTDDYVVPWLRPAGEALVWDLVQREIAEHRADPRRIYLAGQGAGATGALTLASRRPELVAGVAAWSGTPEPLWDADRRVVGLAEPVVAGLRVVPVFLFTARDDPLLDRDALRFFVDGMTRQQRAAGGPGLSWIEGDGGHGFGTPGPARGLTFLKQHQQPAHAGVAPPARQPAGLSGS